jgi:hypothetical protein
MSAAVAAQGRRIPSPAGTAATEIRNKRNVADEVIPGSGKWIEITSGRPIKRGRDLWGSRTDYGEMLNDGAPVWRAGANVSTRLKTEVPMVVGGKTVAPGEYSLFIDLKPRNWTLIVSAWPAQATGFDTQDTTALFGAFGYTPAKDVTRAPMTLGTLPVSIDQLTWSFADMSDTGGKLAIMWDKTIASVPFTVPR